MTAKTILALAQAHRKEPTRQSYAAMANAVRKLEADRATAERNENTALNAMEKLEAERDTLASEVARLTPLQFRQAPCQKFCEANAYEIELRGLRAELEAAPQARQPLTDEQITGIWDEVLGDKDRIHEIRIAFAHGIEAAHGIGGGV